MSRFTQLALAALVAGCSGASVVKSGSGSGTGSVISDESVATLPGSVTSSSVTRYEERDEATGNGYAEDITVRDNGDGTTTFLVDNLAFDGGGDYEEGGAVSSVGRTGINAGPFTVYEGPQAEPDFVTATPISQFNHRAIYAKSTSGNSEFAIVRTGAYTGYGFGGFLYTRNGSVTLPATVTTPGESRQASYSGDYAGLVDYDGVGGIDYMTGRANIAIDFGDFNNGAAIAGLIDNRQLFDVNGNNISQDYLDALNDDLGYAPGSGYAAIPVLIFDVGPGVIDSNGEIAGTLGVSVQNATGAYEELTSGNYYGVIAGDVTQGTDEVVGVIVVEGDAPGAPGVTMRETGGFVVYRQ